MRYFILDTEDNTTAKYIEDLYQIVKDLKEAGAKVVVADAPDNNAAPRGKIPRTAA